MSLAVGAGVLDSPAVILKVLMRLWANTYKKRAYSPIIVLNLVLYRMGRRQKKLAALRFRGLRKSRESCTSAISFFLSTAKPLRLALRLSNMDSRDGLPHRFCFGKMQTSVTGSQ